MPFHFSYWSEFITSFANEHLSLRLYFEILTDTFFLRWLLFDNFVYALLEKRTFPLNFFLFFLELIDRFEAFLHFFGFPIHFFIPKNRLLNFLKLDFLLYPIHYFHFYLLSLVLVIHHKNHHQLDLFEVIQHQLEMN